MELSQITTYPEYLNSTKNKEIKLLFLIPKGYKDRYKIEEIKKKYNFISIIFWDDLLEYLKKENKIIKSEILSESILFFDKILNMLPEIKLKQEEIKFMTDFEKLFKESSAIGKTLELFNNTIEQLKENLKLPFKKGENPWPEVSENGIGYWFYHENCYIGYSFGFLNTSNMEDYILSLAIYKDIISKDKIKRMPKTDYGLDEDWYYFKIDENILNIENKEKVLLQYCEDIMKNSVKNIK